MIRWVREGVQVWYDWLASGKPFGKEDTDIKRETPYREYCLQVRSLRSLPAIRYRNTRLVRVETLCQMDVPLIADQTPNPRPHSLIHKHVRIVVRPKQRGPIA